jgi:hypothetical protein
MNELVKRTHNSDANKNCAPIITKQHNSKQMQQQAIVVILNKKVIIVTTSKQILINQTRNKRNCAHVTSVSLSNQRLQLLYDLQNNFSNDVEVFNPPLIIVLSHEEIGVPSGALNFDPSTNLHCHQLIKIAKKPKVMQDNIVLHTINQQSDTMCHEVFC